MPGGPEQVEILTSADHRVVSTQNDHNCVENEIGGSFRTLRPKFWPPGHVLCKSEPSEPSAPYENVLYNMINGWVCYLRGYMSSSTSDKGGGDAPPLETFLFCWSPLQTSPPYHRKTTGKPKENHVVGGAFFAAKRKQAERVRGIKKEKKESASNTHRKT